MRNSQQANSDLSPVKKILIVEDDPALGHVLLDMLQEEPGYEAFLVQSGERALSMLQTIEPDLFLLDYYLLGINGLELINQLHNQTGEKQRPVILMSAELLPKMIASDHLKTLRKPFDLDRLLQLIAELLTL